MGWIQFELAEEVDGLADRQRTNLGQRARRAIGEFRMPGGDRHRAGLRVEPLAVAVGAAHDLHVLFELPQLHLALRIAVLVEQLGDDPLELPAVFVARGRAPGERDVLVAGAPQPQLVQRRIELVPRRVEHRALGQAVLALDRVGHALIDVALPAAQIAPRPEQLETALLERQLAIGHQQRRVEAVQLAQAVARRAHALRAVEAEELRAGRLEAQAAMRAGIVGRKLHVARAVRRFDRGFVAWLSGWLAGSAFLRRSASGMRRSAAGHWRLRGRLP